MKILSPLFLSVLFSSVTCGDMRQEQTVKRLQQELVQMAPLVTACSTLIKNDMAATEADCMRVIDDFKVLLRELCRAQDSLPQEK